jgi:hypothetical protein
VCVGCTHKCNGRNLNTRGISARHTASTVASEKDPWLLCLTANNLANNLADSYIVISVHCRYGTKVELSGLTNVER